MEDVPGPAGLVLVICMCYDAVHLLQMIVTHGGGGGGGGTEQTDRVKMDRL